MHRVKRRSSLLLQKAFYSTLPCCIFEDMKFLSNYPIRKTLALLLLLFIAVLFHYPRIFFIADQCWQVTGKESFIQNYPMLCKWDCGFYHYLANRSDLTKNPQFSAFFPLFPITLDLLHNFMPKMELSALSVIVSNLFSVISIALITLLGSNLHSAGTRNRFGWNRFGLLLAFAVAVYPNSQFSSYGYPEALFLLIYTGSIFCLVTNNWRGAAVFCGLAAVTRPQGIWILGVFLILVLQYFLLNHSKDKLRFKSVKEIHPTFFQVLVICLLPFFLFLIWQWQNFGHPLSFLKVQSTHWSRSFNLVSGLKNNLPKLDLARIFNILAIYSSFRFIRRNGAHWKMIGVTTFLMTEIPLFFGGYFSYPRFSALNLGVFIMLVEVTQNRFWWMIALLVFAMTRLNVEIHNWLTVTYFMF
jgi:Gpi18-like mannosyltransferase